MRSKTCCARLEFSINGKCLAFDNSQELHRPGLSNKDVTKTCPSLFKLEIVSKETWPKRLCHLLKEARRCVAESAATRDL
ncbi:hypothetical protein HanRHA438_Chr13g0627811 [Helianthus annuus]|nr:hypothetical protein HanRHA438_Chr13g0627811 [Helianthus annuus]